MARALIGPTEVNRNEEMYRPLGEGRIRSASRTVAPHHLLDLSACAMVDLLAAVLGRQDFLVWSG